MLRVDDRRVQNISDEAREMAIDILFKGDSKRSVRVVEEIRDEAYVEIRI